MTLFYAVLCLSLAAVVFSISLIGGRNPKTPRWAADSLVANLYIPILVGLILIGVCLMINLLLNLGKSAPNLTETIASAALAAATLFGIGRLRIKERLAAFGTELPVHETHAEVIPMPGAAPEPEAPKPSGERRSAA
jgi:hypothetical protein